MTANTSSETAGPSGTALVIGAGTMGEGITVSLLDAGTRVVVVEADDALAKAANERIRRGIAHHLGADRAAELDEYLGRLIVTTDPHVDAAVVIEAVPEQADLKMMATWNAEKANPNAQIIASNTSSLSIDELAGGLDRPERFLGMHFFNPVPRSSLIEIIVGTKTAPETVALARAWANHLGKEAIEIKDSPGFATSRLGVAIGLEAIRMVEEGVATPEDIDKGMVLGYRFPMGPLRLTDLVGLDVRLAIAEHLAEELGPRFEPPALLREKVARGELGRKVGKGFYEWS